MKSEKEMKSYKKFTENKDRKDDYQEETEKALEI